MSKLDCRLQGMSSTAEVRNKKEISLYTHSKRVPLFRSKVDCGARIASWLRLVLGHQKPCDVSSCRLYNNDASTPRVNTEKRIFLRSSVIELGSHKRHANTDHKKNQIRRWNTYFKSTLPRNRLQNISKIYSCYNNPSP